MEKEKLINILREGKKMQVKISDLEDCDIVSQRKNGDVKPGDEILVYCSHTGRGHAFYKYRGNGYLLGYDLSDPHIMENGNLWFLDDFMWHDVDWNTEEFKIARYMIDKAMKVAVA